MRNENKGALPFRRRLRSERNKERKHIKVEPKPMESPLPKKQRGSYLASSRKGKEVVTLNNLLDLMGYRTEEAVLAYQNNHSTSVVFDEVTRRRVEKVPKIGEGVMGDVINEEEDKLSGGEPVCILDVDSEAEGLKINDAFTKGGGDVSAGLQTVHKEMDSLLKRASEVAQKMKSSRWITKEFVDRIDPMVDEVRRGIA
ncbi:hypothetical protein Syun_007386 [Stephania yunnanensis]|uniref:Uncharacterized protein n=1 Tax=Stephania yunnanensis TaxID=152371 RepID=A0AAP0KZF3_9MAGN